jgi:hypothetical protein
MRESNNLQTQTPIKQRHDDKNGTIVRAFHPVTDVELGFIRFNENRGILQLTNYNARMNFKSLGIGGTTKKDKQHLAGSHGEGYKIAAAVLK